MNNPIFARPRHDYSPYSDLWKLVELSNYQLIYIDEMDIHDPSKCYIYSTPDAELSFQDAKAKIIYWLLEWYPNIKPTSGVSEIWTMNRWFAERDGHRFVPIGSHPGLCEDVPLPTDKQYDVALLSYIIPRRAMIAHGLTQCGVKLMPDAWGIERSINLLQTHLMLHIHQHEDYPALAPLRACIAAAHKLPIISEWASDTEPYNYLVWFVSYSSLPNFTDMTLKHPRMLAERGQALHEFLCVENTFRKYIEASV